MITEIEIDRAFFSKKMPKFKLGALSTPVAGKEEEFHSWYNQHLREVIALPGARDAQR